MREYQPQPLAAIDTPLQIELVDGEVVFIGPGAIAFSMTKDAAAETAERVALVLRTQSRRINGTRISPE